MSDRTEISWTDSTFNPWMGCTKVGPGCDHCYAERDMDHRYGKVKWGSGNPRLRTSSANWKKPVQWNKQSFCHCIDCGWRGEVRETGHAGNCPICGDGMTKLARRRVFCASLADVFDNEVDPQWRRDLFDLIHATPNLDWLLLTKRIGWVNRLAYDVASTRGWMLTASDETRWPDNVWLGLTVVNQEEADRDIPKLLAIPARVRFLSCEPLLGPIDLRGPMPIVVPEPGLHWVITGGESGPNARPGHPDWYRSLRDQCVAAGVPFHFKQWGEWEPREQWSGHQGGGRFEPMVAIMPDGSPCPYDVTPQDVGAHRMARVGKKAAGRLLDGRTWDGFPT